MKAAPKIVVAGVGNVLLGDDGFGVAVARRMIERGGLPSGVRVVDVGIRGFDLALALADADAAVIVDAMQRGSSAGTITVIEPDVASLAVANVDTHGMTPARVLGFLRAADQRPPRIVVVGCEPHTFGEDGVGYIGLSDAVAAAVDGAVDVVTRIVTRFSNVEVARA